MMSTNPSDNRGPRRDFYRLWVGQSLSLLGDQFAVLALPLLAVEVAGASVAQAALLPFALFAPFLLFGLPAGAVVDRLPRRSTMLACDAMQAVVFVAIATLAVLGMLTFPVLLGLVFVAGSAVVFFQVAYTSYLPELVSGGGDLQSGNSRLYFSESVSRTIGPMAAGPVIAAFGVVAAIAFDAVTFVASVASLLLIRHRAGKPAAQPRERGWLLRDIREGLAFVFRHDKIEPAISCGVVYVAFLSMIESSLVLYCKDVLGLSAASIGLVVGATAAGFPIGNLLSPKLVARVRVGRTLAVSAAVAVCGLVLTPVAGAAGSVPALILASIVHGVGEGAFGPTSLTLRQTETPAALLGRVNSVQRFLIWGAIPFGSLMTFVCIGLWGLSAALWVGGLGTVLCLPVLMRRGLLREVLRRREVPSAVVPAHGEPAI
jgi:MFS family permease